MADILEYLDWRGDIPFDVDPFNDVDNLILAQIAYTDFEGVILQHSYGRRGYGSRYIFQVCSSGSQEGVGVQAFSGDDCWTIYQYD